MAIALNLTRPGSLSEYTNAIKSGAPIVSQTDLNNQYNATIQDRYNQIQGKSEAELASMGITFMDDTYWKDGKAWLTKNNIDTITGRWSQLVDSSGNYLYPLDIPQDIMGDVVNKYGATLTKDELIKIARDVYQKTGNNLSNSSINAALSDVESQTQQTNPNLANKMADSNSLLSSTLMNSDSYLPKDSKSFFKKYGWWMLGGIAFIGLVYFIIPKRKS